MRSKRTILHLVWQPVVLPGGGTTRAKVQWTVLVYILNIGHVRPTLHEEHSNIRLFHLPKRVSVNLVTAKRKSLIQDLIAVKNLPN